MKRAVEAALRYEVLTLLRTREAWTLALLPAALFAPVVLMLVGLAATFQGEPRLAVPLGASPISEAELAGFDVVHTAAPDQLWAAGAVDVAITRWELWGPPVAELQVDGLWHTQGQAEALRSALREQLHDEADAAIRRAGGDPDAIPVARVISLPVDASQVMWTYLVSLAGMFGCFTLPTRTASDRSDGVLEALACTGTPIAVLLVARAAVATGFGLLVGSGAVLPFAWLVQGETGLTVGLPGAIEATSVLLLCHVVFVHVGLRSESTRTALTVASVVLMVLWLLVAAGLALGLRDVPLAAMCRDAGLGPWATRMAGTLGLLGTAVAALAIDARREVVLPATGTGG
jgi:hypothetical protein